MLMILIVLMILLQKAALPGKIRSRIVSRSRNF